MGMTHTGTCTRLSIVVGMAMAGLQGCADLTLEQVADVLTRRPPAGNQSSAPPTTTAGTSAPSPASPPSPATTPLPPPPATAGMPMDDLLGTWVNSDPNTKGMTKLVITKVNHQMVGLHGYGQCSPTDCDWGTIEATFAQPSTVGTYQFNFKQTRISVRRAGESLRLETVDHYTDRSDRQDRTEQYVFNKVQLRAPTVMFPRR